MRHTYFFLSLLLLALLASPAWAQVPQVGIGINSPTQTLDVNGNLRVRGLSGDGARLLLAQPDGTLGLNASLYDAQVSSEVPGLLGTAATPAGTRALDLEIVGNRAFVLTTSSGTPAPTLACYDVSNPGRPLLLVAQNLTLVPVAMAVNETGTRVYVASSGRIYTYDATVPGALPQIGTGIFLAAGGVRDLAVRGTTAYVATTTDLRTYDVTDNTTANTPLGAVPLAASGVRIVLNDAGSRAYALSNNLPNAYVQQFDVSNVAAPALLATSPATYYASGLAFDNGRVYVGSANPNTGAQKLEAYDAASLALLGSGGLGAPNGDLFQVAARGNFAYVATGQGFKVIDVRNPAAINTAYASPTASPTILGGSVAAQGNTFFVLHESNFNPGILAQYQQPQPGPPRAVAVNADGTLASVPLPSLSLNGQTLSLSGGSSITLPTGDNLGNGLATTAVRLPDLDLYLRGGNDSNHGLGYYNGGSGARSWNGEFIDGPVLYGYEGGALGSRRNGTASTALRWTAAGNVGLGLAGAQPSLRLDVAGGLALRPNATIPVTADDQTVPVGNSSYLRLSSNSSTASSRTIVLGNGLQAGQLLMLENAGSSGSFELPDSANVDVSGTLTLTTADVVQLVWNGGKWVALSYSNN